MKKRNKAIVALLESYEHDYGPIGVILECFGILEILSLAAYYHGACYSDLDEVGTAFSTLMKAIEKLKRERVESELIAAEFDSN